MANTSAYTVSIGANTKNTDEAQAINQSSPAWVLTFVRWYIRDPLRTPNSAPNTVKPTLVVENDCIQLTVADNKGVLTPSMSATLVQTDVNYETEVAPGDFVFVNILNWENDARGVADAARAGKAINGPSDGFKGFYKVQSVRKMVSVDPQTGVKSVMFKIDGFAFTEFNNTIYFNPNLINQKSIANQGLYIDDISKAWASFVSKAGKPYVQEVIAFLIQSFIGSGINPKATMVGGLLISPNTHFLVPLLVGQLLGISSSTPVLAAKDVYAYLFGIQKYASGSVQTLQNGMNPSNINSTQTYPGFYYTGTPCQGNTILKPEYWNQVKAWSILNQYTNAPLNELFTCFRISPNGSVMPTVVFRQIPFTSPDFVNQTFGVQDTTSRTILTTEFLTLPRWKIDSSFVFSADIGRDEAARINFVQYYAKSNYTDTGIETSGETASGNYSFDKADIARSGLRPYVVQNQFDDLPDRLVVAAKNWARVLADAVIGGHLRLNGTLNCIGIADPIAIGDNLEFDGVVYHLEQIAHTCSISHEGIKLFRTTLSLSHGISINSSDQGLVFSLMTYGDAYLDRNHDYQNSQILPGVSESQDSVYRTPTNPDLTMPDPPTSKGVSFPQPTLVKNKIKTGE